VADPSKEPLVEVRNLKMYFPITAGVLRRRKVAEVRAIDDVSFEIYRGQTLGLVGESGCGKTTTGRCVLRVYRPTSGQIFFQGKDISTLPEEQIRLVRRQMQLIFQDPFSSLDPRQNAGSIVGEPLQIHHRARGSEYRDRVSELLRMVGLDPSMASRFPHEFSGGQRQRIGIARALAMNPAFIVCDEPVSALDVSIQAQITNLLEELKNRLGLTYLFISHDLSVVRHISNQVGVMYLGRIVEITSWRELYEDPLHPYTQALLSAVPIPDPFVEEQRKRIFLEGDVPSPINPPAGCTFHPRCDRATGECKDVIPSLRQIRRDHKVACIRL
jgi:oligopeptide/dipeptide ABC transporter ATP-binding protein